MGGRIMGMKRAIATFVLVTRSILQIIEPPYLAYGLAFGRWVFKCPISFFYFSYRRDSQPRSSRAPQKLAPLTLAPSKLAPMKLA
ncbi:hypothetical protein NIES932_25240 [Raphidiopsis curvata NIES-932]|nr:hypothetical protein NIES932_25240 [Raphidiopsis curvata NIES-932]